MLGRSAAAGTDTGLVGQSGMTRARRSSGCGEDADCGVAVPFKTRAVLRGTLR